MTNTPPPVIKIENIIQLLDPDGNISGVVEITLQELIEEDYCGLDKLAAERLLGPEYEEKLCNIKFTIVGHTNSTIFLKVLGDPRLITRDLKAKSETVSSKPSENSDSD